MKGLKKKNQHYVTEKYLANFCRDGDVWLRDTEKREYRRGRAGKVARINYYNSPIKDGARAYTIEDGLAEVESNAIPILLDLSEGKQISARSKFRFSLFAAYQLFRVPKYQRHVERMATKAMQRNVSMSLDNLIKAQIEKLIKEHGPLDLYPNDWRRTLSVKSAEAIFEREFSLNMMIQNGLPLAKFLWSLNWAILHTEGSSRFITSDNPFVLLRPPHLPKDAVFDVNSVGCGKLLPLTPKCALFMRDQGSLLHHEKLPDPLVDHFNRVTAGQHFRYLFAQELDSLEKVQELADKVNESGDKKYNQYNLA